MAESPLLNVFMNATFRTDPVTAELEKKRRAEFEAARSLAFDAIAYRTMPADLRAAAENMRVSSLMDAVWMAAWESGYKQAVRDRNNIETSKSNGGNADG